MSVKVICLRKYSSSFAANVAVAKLANGGINSFLNHEEIVLIDPSISSIELMVASADFEKASRILNEVEKVA